MYISSADELQTFCERARHASVLAIDTEFMREKTFYPKLCLVQVGTGEEIAAIDPLAIADLEPLAALLVDDRIPKVFHACSQDLEVLRDALGVVPTPVFDTQVAAAFLGHRNQIGYGALVESYTGVRLPKAESLTDWTRRPLSQEQLEYAEDDVRYLPGIYDAMMSELVRRDRLSWVLPEIADLADPSRYDHDPRSAYLHVKRSGSLTRKQLAVAREVAAWREGKASYKNIPRKWVLSDEVLVEICKICPKNAERLGRIRGMDHVSHQSMREILRAVDAGLRCPPEQMPEVRRRARPSADTESVVDLMYALLRVRSEETGVATQLIATRDDLVELANVGRSDRLGHGWRHEIVGASLERLLAGEVGLTVRDGRIEVL